MTRRLALAGLVFLVLAAGRAAAYEPADRPLGKWERKVGKNICTLVFEENRLHIVLTGEASGTIHADYAMTRDGTVYGVVTSFDTTEEPEKLAEVMDMPFSFRFRIDEGMLLLRDFKSPQQTGGKDEVQGRYKRVGPEPARTSPPPPPVGVGTSSTGMAPASAMSRPSDTPAAPPAATTPNWSQNYFR
jgi:hypothetical protein